MPGGVSCAGKGAAEASDCSLITQLDELAGPWFLLTSPLQCSHPINGTSFLHHQMSPFPMSQRFAAPSKQVPGTMSACWVRGNQKITAKPRSVPVLTL